MTSPLTTPRSRARRAAIAATIVAALAGTMSAAIGAATLASAAALDARSPSAASTPRGVPARAIGMPRASDADTTVEDFLQGLSDSTDAYFGTSAAPLDTAGLDSARAFGLEHPGRESDRGSLRPRFGPALGFNRVDGPVYGATAHVGRPRRGGRLDARLQWAAGPNDLLGYGELSKVIQRGEGVWEVRLRGGRETVNMDRDRGDTHLAGLRAFVNGNDRRSYLRHDGAQLTAERTGTSFNISLGYRDQLETPRVTTATWNLMHKVPKRVDNLPAARGRARELSYGMLWRLPRTPISVAAAYQSSTRALNSEFEYRRLLLAGGADFGVGRVLSIVPQVSYGSLTGEPIPQESFYLGGPRNLRSVKTQTIGGTRMALARIDVIEIPDLLELAHIPHPDAFPIQGAVFAGVGAVWGPDPFGGPGSRGGEWPNVEEWKSEAGFSLLYQPGVPDATGFLRLSFAWALGPKRDVDRLSISYSRAFDLLRPFDP